MTNNNSTQRLWRSIAYWTLFLAAETMTQVVFKIAGGALDLDAGLSVMLTHAIASLWVWAGFALYFIDFVLWMLILKNTDLGRAFPISSLVYVTTLIAALTIFHEQTNPVRLVGLFAIIAGVAILSGDEDTEQQPPSPTGRTGAGPPDEGPVPTL